MINGKSLREYTAADGIGDVRPTCVAGAILDVLVLAAMAEKPARQHLRDVEVGRCNVRRRDDDCWGSSQVKAHRKHSDGNQIARCPAIGFARLLTTPRAISDSARQSLFMPQASRRPQLESLCAPRLAELEVSFDSLQVLRPISQLMPPLSDQSNRLQVEFSAVIQPPWTKSPFWSTHIPTL